MNKIFSKFTNYGFGAFFSLIIILSLYSLGRMVGRTSSLAPLITICLAITAAALCLCFDILQKKLDDKIGDNSRRADRIFLIMAFALLAVQIIFALTNSFEPSNDLKYLCTMAKNLVTEGNTALYNGLPERHRHYLAVYPNNHMLFLIIALLYKIQYTLTGEITNFLPTALNIIGLNLSYILMYKCAKLIYTPSKSLVCAAKGLLFTPLITYTLFFYTDSMGMPWLTGAFYLYLKWRNFKENGDRLAKRIALIVGCALLIAVAYKIKGSAIILIPAIFLDLIFRQKGIKNKLLPFACIAVIFAVCAAIIGNIACSVLNISDEELDRYEFPSVHWIMMSADGRGGYERSDFDYTQRFDSYDKKTSADIDRMKEKVRNEGGLGFLGHLRKKLTYTWKGSTFMANYYIRGNKFLETVDFRIFTAILHFTLLFGMAKSYLSRRKSDNDVLEGNFILKVTLMGLTVFLMLWEARCRYLVSFFLLFALL